MPFGWDASAAGAWGTIIQAAATVVLAVITIRYVVETARARTASEQMVEQQRQQFEHERAHWGDQVRAERAATERHLEELRREREQSAAELELLREEHRRRYETHLIVPLGYFPDVTENPEWPAGAVLVNLGPAPAKDIRVYARFWESLFWGSYPGLTPAQQVTLRFRRIPVAARDWEPEPGEPPWPDDFPDESAFHSPPHSELHILVRCKNVLDQPMKERLFTLRAKEGTARRWPEPGPWT